VKKTLREREIELQALLSTPAGRDELREMEVRYRDAGAGSRAPRTSLITYLLVFERIRGLIVV
jgi:hypothetical protein